MKERYEKPEGKLISFQVEEAFLTGDEDFEEENQNFSSILGGGPHNPLG